MLKFVKYFSSKFDQTVTWLAPAKARPGRFELSYLRQNNSDRTRDALWKFQGYSSCFYLIYYSMLANKAQGSKSRQLIDGYVIHGDEGSYQFKW